MSNHAKFDAVLAAPGIFSKTPPARLPLPAEVFQAQARPEIVIVLRGMHHGTDSYRVSIGEEIFSGPTRDEALAKAALSVLSDGRAHQIRIAEEPNS
jgi:hypothetical protein